MTLPSAFRAAFLAGLPFAAFAAAHGDPAQPAPAKVSGKDYVLTHKSSFKPSVSTARNPFWPIGWTPTAPTSGPAAPITDVQASDFSVTTTSLDYPSLAVINGRTYGVGDRVPVAAHPGEFATVTQILDGAVNLDFHGAALHATDAPAAPAKPK
jgi:hypothetical protein